MSQKSERLEVRLTPELYTALQNEANHRGKSMGEMVREAVTEYFAGARSTKLSAVERLARLDAPVGEWEEMEQQIIRGAGKALPADSPERSQP